MEKEVESYQLDNPSTEMEFQLELQNWFQLLVDETGTCESNVDSLLEQTTTTIKKVVDKILGAHRPKKKPCISDATLALTAEKRMARKKAPSHQRPEPSSRVQPLEKSHPKRSKSR